MRGARSNARPYRDVFGLSDIVATPRTLCLIYELIDRAPVGQEVLPSRRQDHAIFGRITTRRDVFAAAAVVAPKYPLFELGMCICLFDPFMLKPEAPRSEVKKSEERLAASAYPQNVRFRFSAVSAPNVPLPREARNPRRLTAMSG